LQPAILLRRYKRFLADVRLPDGSEITVHTPNTGAMTGCAEPGSTVYLRDVASPTRKYRYSWEMTQNHDGVLIGVHTGITNTLVREAIESGLITDLQGYQDIRQEVAYGQEGSRIDLLLQGHASQPDCYVEIKNVTTCDAQELGWFPDAVSVRASKHLRELMHVVEQGQRGVVLFCIQRDDVQGLRPADEVDARYGQTLREAMSEGVEAMAWVAEVTPGKIQLYRQVPVVL
jgi:sugar fermentation stimulation protein A